MNANVQIIERDGVPEYAVIPCEEYEEMARLSEQMRDIRAYDAAMADAGETVPHAVMQRLVNGDSPLRVWREHRAFTQAALAQRAGIDKTYLSQIETGRKQGSVAALAQLASALSVEVDDLIDSGMLDGLERTS
ncbi:MAG: helix-turn-helix domain-containing protein [Candidatus Thiosymbion ectosymbiont of Robbea hypermnestra]|nr:helix-turn-helix domain-containing protein [Candidatus Thiosymbion ectosymbiont of Robbea hypermnestra]